MRRTKSLGYAVASILVAAGISLPASAARADNPPFTVSFPAGEYCTFAFVVSGAGGNNAVRHATNEKIISGGTGSALTFTNPANGKSVSFPSNGAVEISTPNPNPTPTPPNPLPYMLRLMGHNVVLLASTDKPPGPSTTLIVGRAVISVDAAGDFNVLSVSGQQTDICALMS
jgi:hypothetical protein